MKTLTIRVSDEEHKLMQAVAARRFMSITGITRAHFNSLFVEDGLVLDPSSEAKRALKAEAAPPKPVIERMPIPTIPNAWREEIMRRVDSGERIADVAESYGVSVDMAKQKYRDAKEQAAVRPTLPTYAPVDPDNPTEAEQKANADIARQKLIDMGLL